MKSKLRNKKIAQRPIKQSANDHQAPTPTSKLRKALLDGAEHFFRRAAVRQSSIASKDGGQYFRQHLYFVTITFRQFGKPKMPGLNDKLFEMEHEAFRGWYLKLCRKIIDQHFSRTPHLQPQTIVWVDVGNPPGLGKASQKTTFAGRQTASFADLANVHLHALMLIHPETKQAFDDLLSTFRIWFSFRNDRRIDKLDIRPFDPAKLSLPGLISYCAKALLQNPYRENKYGDLYRYYPEFDRQQSTYQRAAKKLRKKEIAKHNAKVMRSHKHRVDQ